MTDLDKWILSRLNKACMTTKKAYDTYSFDVMADELLEFFWYDFCDKYIETVKPIITSENGSQTVQAQILLYVLNSFVRLLHPIMPFITEELWHLLPQTEGSIMKADYPQYDEKFNFANEEKIAEIVFETVRGIRSLRSDAGIAPKKIVKINVSTKDENYLEVVKKYADTIKILAGAEIIISSEDNVTKALVYMYGVNQILLSAEEIDNLEKQIADMEREASKIAKLVESLNKKLSNKAFIENADQNIIENEKARLAEAQVKESKLTEQIKILKS